MPKVKHSTSKMSHKEEMRKQPDATKNPNALPAAVEHKHAYSPYVKSPRKYDKILSNFMSTHLKQLGKMRANLELLTTQMRTVQTELREKNENISTLKQQIKKKEQEIAEILKAQGALKSENMPLKLELNQVKAKFCDLEICYEKALSTLYADNEQLKQQIEQQNLNRLSCAEEFDANRKEWQDKLTEKQQEIAAQQENNLALQHKIEQLHEELQNEHNKMQNIMSNISSLKAELLEKDAVIVKSREQMEALERAKNKVIDEQKFKIREIERVFNQSTNVVAPQLNSTASPVFVAPLPTPDESTATITSSIAGRLHRTTSSSAPRIRGSQQNTLQHSQQSSTIEGRLRPRHQRLPQTETEFSSDDEEFECWRLNIIDNSREISTTGQRQPIGFQRHSDNDVYVADSSESNPRSNLSKN